MVQFMRLALEKRVLEAAMEYHNACMPVESDSEISISIAKANEAVENFRVACENLSAYRKQQLTQPEV